MSTHRQGKQWLISHQGPHHFFGKMVIITSFKSLLVSDCSLVPAGSQVNSRKIQAKSRPVCKNVARVLNAWVPDMNYSE